MGPQLQDTWHLLGIHSTANMKNPLPGKACSEPFWVTKRQSEAVDHCVRSARNAMLRRSPAAGGAQGPVLAMSYATFSLPCSDDTSPSLFRAFLLDTRRLSAQGAPS